MDELLEQFLIEGRELVQLASDDLLALEDTPDDTARIDSAFRAIHTLKGSVGMFDFAPMGVALHAAEDLMGAVRDGRLVPDRAVVDTLMACIAATERWIEAIGRTGALPADTEAEGQALAKRLRASLAGDQAPRAAAAPGPGDTGWMAALLARAPAQPAGGVLCGVHYTPSRDCFFLGDDPMALVRAMPGLVALHIEAPPPESFDDPFTCLLVVDALSTAPLADIQPIFRFVRDQVVFAETAPAVARHEDGIAATIPRTLRIDAGRLDAVADLVGELIVAKNRLAHLAAEAGAHMPALGRLLMANHADIDRLVGEMHRTVMGARMVPLGQTLRRLPRLVRDIAGRLGKSVRFDIAGGETEADKTIVDGLFEPLLHVLRNAVDHGIEQAAARQASGKDAAGRIAVLARSTGDRIVVTVTDDGAGIDPARVRRTALARGVMPGSAIAALDDTGALDLIFAPGFSTAAEITDVSGRGVGLDAVRAALHGMGGTVAVTTTQGSGSIFRLAVPQAAAVTTIVLVQAGGDRFGVPIESVAETARIPRHRILPIRDGAAFALRDQTIPLLRLTKLLHLPTASPTADANVLVTSGGDSPVGVEVDGFGERVDVILRPMNGLLADTPGVLGTALLGDGRVLMVLDLTALIG